MSVFDEYISKVETDLRGGKVTEHTDRGTLEILMESFERGIEASNDPKHIDCGVLGSEWVIFENSAHFTHIEETERYLQVLDQFLSRVERRCSSFF